MIFAVFFCFDIMKRKQLRERKTSVDLSSSASQLFAVLQLPNDTNLRSPTTAFERAWDGRSRLVCCIKPMSKSQKGWACFQTRKCWICCTLIFLLCDWFVLAFFSFQFAFCILMSKFKNNELNFACKKCASEHVWPQHLSAASPSFPYFHQFFIQKTKVPTVTRDIIYGWARGLVGPLLLDCFAPSTFTHKADDGHFFGNPAFVDVSGRLFGIPKPFFSQTSQILKHKELGEAFGVMFFFLQGRD